MKILQAQDEKPLFTNGFFEDYSNADYHRSALKELIGSTDIKEFERSPAHYLEAKTNPKPETPALTFGSAFHSIALGFPDEVAIEPIGINKRTKDGKAEFQDFVDENVGKYIVSATQYVDIKKMVDSIYRHRYARSLLEGKNVAKEITGIFEDPGTGLWCKFRPDVIDFDRMIISDLKSTADAAVDKFAKKDMWNFKYHYSACWYTTGAQVITTDVFEFILIAVEKTAPYGCNVFRVPPKAIEMAGSTIFGSLMGPFADCVRKNVWPCYPQQLITPDVPAWVYKWD